VRCFAGRTSPVTARRCGGRRRVWRLFLFSPARGRSLPGPSSRSRSGRSSRCLRAAVPPSLPSHVERASIVTKKKSGTETGAVGRREDGAAPFRGARVTRARSAAGRYCPLRGTPRRHRPRCCGERLGVPPCPFCRPTRRSLPRLFSVAPGARGVQRPPFAPSCPLMSRRGLS
jgi:hypothetical protein